ncbi:hypothetical protein GTO91_12740 [Heliobacterium undosum]|uniref:Uncharacterized protein n=1 Tax=Heliomicrobium undosum TaxID=121734 RepID=A0A845LCE2_9FIRM|nr:hypothetical protein [Heliomicrobium undosum]MZP30581.1 hypothetical protein [Heliomicrobium undosum]
MKLTDPHSQKKPIKLGNVKVNYRGDYPSKFNDFLIDDIFDSVTTKPEPIKTIKPRRINVIDRA